MAHDLTDPMDSLRHVLDVFSSQPDIDFAIVATDGEYGPGVKTGLSWADLRELRSRLEFVEEHLRPDWDSQAR